MSDGTTGGRGEGELPPDPWAGLAGPASPPPLPPPPPVEHPSMTSGPPTRRTIWQHPGVWVALVGLAVVLLVGALLEPSPSTRSEPAPDAVTAVVGIPVR